MSFITGFEKTAVDIGSLTAKAGKVLAGTKEVGAAALKGVKASGGSTIGDALKLKGLGHITSAAERAGGWGKAVGTSEGRKMLGEGVGKATPSIAAGIGYGALAKKLYNKATGSSDGYYYG